MEKQTYNGWTNYATWRVNLEVFDQLTPADFWGFENCTPADAYELGKSLKEYAEEFIFESSPAGLVRDYALTFLSDVNWHEIAKSMIEASVEA
jgi:hypothetical protein